MKKVLLIFILAFFLNWIWENLHSYLYLHYQGGEITQLTLSRAALFDAAVITIIALPFIAIPFFRKRKWLAFVFGVVIAVFIEIYAFQTGRWIYNEYMPTVPFLNIGITPALQLGALSYFIYKMIIRDEKRKEGLAPTPTLAWREAREAILK